MVIIIEGGKKCEMGRVWTILYVIEPGEIVQMLVVIWVSLSLFDLVGLVHMLSYFRLESFLINSQLILDVFNECYIFHN